MRTTHQANRFSIFTGSSRTRTPVAWCTADVTAAAKPAKPTADSRRGVSLHSAAGPTEEERRKIVDYIKTQEKEGKIAFDVEHVLKPKEGGLGWVDTWMVSSEADSERTELAHAWINMFLAKDNYVRVVRSTGYGGVVDVRSLLTPDEIELYFQNRSAEASQRGCQQGRS